MRALTQIADAKREAIILRFFHNVPYAEMSEICGAPEGTLKFRVHDGLKDIERIVGPRIGQAVQDMVRQGTGSRA
jgi:DNA-directed RNA polymerase specialized sigma24 family protein